MATFTNVIPTASTLSFNVARLNTIIAAIEVEFTPSAAATPVFERGDTWSRDIVAMNAWLLDVMTVATIQASHVEIPWASTFELNIRKLNEMFTLLYAEFA